MNSRVRITSFGKFIFALFFVGVAVVGHYYVERYRTLTTEVISYQKMFLINNDNISIVKVSMDNGKTWAFFEKETGTYVHDKEESKDAQ